MSFRLTLTGYCAIGFALIGLIALLAQPNSVLSEFVRIPVVLGLIVLTMCVWPMLYRRIPEGNFVVMKKTGKLLEGGKDWFVAGPAIVAGTAGNFELNLPRLGREVHVSYNVPELANFRLANRMAEEGVGLHSLIQERVIRALDIAEEYSLQTRLKRCKRRLAENGVTLSCKVFRHRLTLEV